MRRVAPVFTAVLAAAVAFAPGAAAADSGRGSGSPPTLSDPIATGLVVPLQIAVDEGRTYIAQGTGVITVIDRKGNREIPAPGVDGLDVDDGKVVYSTRADGEAGSPGFFAALKRVGRDGISNQVADLWAYEQKANPDQVNTYGFESIPADCAAQLPPPPDFPPVQYTGVPDSNPFGVLVSDEKTYVADAGANAILEVSRSGRIRTVAVLPPQPAVVTAEAAAEVGFPDCTVGLTYRFEPVPTDIEKGRDGKLFVTTLPGGPESPALGARGSVWSLDPRSGALRQVATGFLGATNLAVSPKGDIYVSEIFGGRVSKAVPGGAPQTVVELPLPSGLEWSDGRLYVSYDVFGDGKVSTIKLNGKGS